MSDQDQPRPNFTRLSREEIEGILPHRGQALLLDYAYVDTESGIAHGFLLLTDEHCRGHFPNTPIMKGFDRCEMIALTLGLAASKKLAVPEGFTVVLGGVGKIKFRGMVRAGDLVRAEVVLTDIREIHGQKVLKGDGKAFVGDNLVADVEGLTGGIAKLDLEEEKEKEAVTA